MRQVSTPDGWGQILRTESAHGRTSYLVKGAGFEGWYDGLQVIADFADHPDDVVPNEDNDTVLPYPSQAQGPGWDGTTSTIQPNIDPHLEMGTASDSLTGDSTDENPVKADIEGLFEPHSRLSGVRAHRLHNTACDDPILDVSTIPDDSPVGLDNSPINPDNVDTDDLFDDSQPHFERESAVYDRLVIEDGLSFLKYADDDDKKKHHKDHGSGQPGFFRNDDEDDDSSSDDSDSDGEGEGDSSHTASVALTTTADLHFLANMCHCAEALPLHSKLEHRELLVEAASDVDGVTPQVQDLDKLLERYEQGNFNYQESNLRNLVDRSEDKGDGGELLNHYASVGKLADGYDKYIGGDGDSYYLIASGDGKLPKGEHYGHYDSYEDAHNAVEAIIARNHSRHSSVPKVAAPAQQDAQPTQIESQIEQLMQFWAVDNNGWWHWTGSQADLALLNQMQQQMMMVGAPGGPPGQQQMQAQSSFVVEANTPEPWKEYLQVIASDRLVALAAWKDVVQKSKQLRAEGAIDLEVFKPEVITAYVQGDNGRYYTTVQRLGSVPGAGRQLTSTQVSGWSCECDWGHWAWLRKRSFVGRMCSHAYALFSEMRSLDAKARRGKGKPLSAGKFASVGNKSSWVRAAEGGFEWVSDDPTLPTAVIAKIASGWSAQIWSDGTTTDSMSLGVFSHSEQARRVVARVITAHIKIAEEGDVDMVGGPFEPYQSPDSISGGYVDPYSEDGAPEPLTANENQQGSAGVQDGTTRTGSTEHDDGQDDEGPEETDNGIEEEDPDDDDEESLDEEIAQDEGDGSDDQGDDEKSDDGGRDEPHRDEDDGEGTDNPGDDSDDDHVEKTSSVAELQAKFGLTHLAGANYSLIEQDKLVREGDGKTARNRGDLNLTGTHYVAGEQTPEAAEDVLAFLF